MTGISINNETNRLEIRNYNGNSEETSKYRVMLTTFPRCLNFFREGDNHSYVKGKIFYEGECENTLVVSPYADNSLRNVRNAFVFVEGSFIEVSPIHDLIEVIDKAKSCLSGKRVNYNIPSSVLIRENLNRKDLGSLEKVLSESYGITPKKVISIPSKSKRWGIFCLIDRNSNNYVFKFRNQNKDRAETLSEITELIPGFFPRNYKRVDSQRYTIDMGDGWYGLESFINGETKERDLDYFSLMGKNIRKLQQELNQFLKNRPESSKIFSQSSHLSESNIASLYLDLFVNIPDNFLLSELEEMIYENFNSRIRNLQRALIHRDLNQSNVLWIKEKPTIIDSESISISERINEFIPTLLLQGNRTRPDYVKGSLYEIVKGYKGSNSSSDEETEILPKLLGYSLIKYFVVRNIRRNFGRSEELEELKKDLNQIKQETLL